MTRQHLHISHSRFCFGIRVGAWNCREWPPPVALGLGGIAVVVIMGALLGTTPNPPCDAGIVVREPLVGTLDQGAAVPTFD